MLSINQNFEHQPFFAARDYVHQRRKSISCTDMLMCFYFLSVSPNDFDFQLKKETDMGGVMLNDCLQVQQMQLEQMQQTPPETVDMRGLVTGPTTDLYSGKIYFKSSHLLTKNH